MWRRSFQYALTAAIDVRAFHSKPHATHSMCSSIRCEFNRCTLTIFSLLGRPPQYGQCGWRDRSTNCLDALSESARRSSLSSHPPHTPQISVFSSAHLRHCILTVHSATHRLRPGSRSRGVSAKNATRTSACSGWAHAPSFDHVSPLNFLGTWVLNRAERTLVHDNSTIHSGRRTRRQLFRLRSRLIQCSRRGRRSLARPRRPRARSTGT